MNLIQTLPRWASAPLQQFADRQQIRGTQAQGMDQESFDQFTQTAVGMIEMAATDEIEGKDLAMGQPGVVSPQEGVELRFTGSPSSSTGTLTAVLDVADQGVAAYLRSAPDGMDTAMIQRSPTGGIQAQGAYIEAAAGGFRGMIIAGPVL